MKSRRRPPKNFPVNEAFISDDRMRLFELAVVCICLCLFFVHFLTSFSYSNWFWGVNYLYFFPPFFRWSITLLGIIICIPPIARILFRLLKNLSFRTRLKKLKRIDRRVWYGLASLISFVPFWFLRSKTHFLGDGYLLIASIYRGSTLSSRRFLYTHINKSLNSIFGWDATITCPFVSCFCGVLFVFGVLLLGDSLTKDKLRKALIWGLLLSMGGIELFFGYVEVYTLLVVGILYYLLFSLYYLNHKCSLVIPAIVLTVAFFAHDSAICLLPSLIYLSLLMGKNTFRKDDNKGVSKKALFRTSIVISIYVVFYGILTLFYRHSQAMLARRIYKGLGPISLPWNKLWLFFTGLMPIKGNALESGNHTMFSFVHLSNIINEHILIAPVGLVLCGLVIMLIGWKRIVRNQIELFLGIASVLYFLLSLTYNPLNGASRDWDVFTPAGFLYTVLAVYLLTKFIFYYKSLRYVTVILVFTSLLHSIPWIIVNADEGKGLSRFQLMINSKPQWSSFACGHGHDSLGCYFSGMGKFDEAAEEWEKALDFSYNPRYVRFLSEAYFNLGALHLKKGLSDIAIEEFERALDINPEIAIVVHNSLGIAYEKKGLIDEAIREYQEALKINPKYTRAHYNLGNLFYDLYGKVLNNGSVTKPAKRELREKAVYSYRQFIKYWTGDPEYKKKAEENINRLRGIR